MLHAAPPIAVVIVAPSGIWRDALVSLVRAQPDLALRSVTDDLAAVRSDLALAPVHALIADIGLGEGDLAAFAGWLHANAPGVRCVVAVDAQCQEDGFRSIGVHATLLKGCLDEVVLRASINLAR